MTDASNSLSPLVRSIAVSVQSAVQASWSAVLLRSADGEWYETAADSRPDAPFIRLRHNGQVPKWLETQDAVLRREDPFFKEPAVQFDQWDDDLFDEYGTQLAAPISGTDGLNGVVLVGKAVAGNAYPVSALNYLKSISSVAGMAVSAHTGATPVEQKSDDQVLRRMAHDIKGPLATVMTYLDLLRQNKPGNLNEAQLNRIDKANRSGRRLLRVLNDFVDFARLRAGSLGLERTEFGIDSLVAEVSDLMIPSMDSRSQELRCTTPPQPVKIWADRPRMSQIITSLVGNASRYSADGTPVDLELWAEGNRLRIRVTDRGRGLSEEQTVKVFEPLDPDQPSRRSENDQTEAGSGLGLVLARGLVELHGGTLTLRSKTGAGTIAEIDLPVVLAGELRQSDVA